MFAVKTNDNWKQYYVGVTVINSLKVKTIYGIHTHAHPANNLETVTHSKAL